MKITQKITAMLVITAIIVSAFSFGAMGATPVKGSEVAVFALQFEGHRYQYACKGPENFDCSGLVYYVLKNFGITFGNSTSEYNTAEKAKNFGNVIENAEDSKPGDIVVWGSHAGIYLGEGKCISSMNSKKGVVVTEVEKFVDKHGVKNPKHIFIRPFDYVDETAEEITEETAGENTVGATETAPEETNLTFIEKIRLMFDRIGEFFEESFAPITNAFKK